MTALRFSIIVPTFNRPVEVAGLLESLCRLSYPHDGFEVIIVDDGGDARLDSLVAPFRDRLSISLLRQTNQGPGRARNFGATVAAGQWLAFTDDDCRPDADWLIALEAALTKQPMSLVGGRTINFLTSNLYSEASQFIVDLVYAFYNERPDAARFFASNNFAMSRDLFESIGGFDPRFFRSAAEDRDLCDRWLHAGRPMACAAGAIIGHGHALTLRSFCRQHFTYGRGALRYQRQRRRRGSGTMSRDMGFHLRLPAMAWRAMRGRPWSLLRRGGIVALLAMWQVINALGFFYEYALHLGERRQPPVPHTHESAAAR